MTHELFKLSSDSNSSVKSSKILGNNADNFNNFNHISV